MCKNLSETFEYMCKWYEKRVGHFLPENKSVKLLDLGCGDGRFIHFLKKKGYQNVIGVDKDVKKIQLAEQMGVKGILQTDILNFIERRGENEFDLVSLFDVLEHFSKEEILKLSKGIYKILKKNGVLIVRTPNGESVFAGTFFFADLTHKTCFTRISIRTLLVEAGFKEVKIFPALDYFPSGLRSSFKYILWKCFEMILTLYMMAATGSLKENYIFTQNLLAVAIR